MALLDELTKPRAYAVPTPDHSEGEGNTIARVEVDRRDWVKASNGRAVRAPEQGFTSVDFVVSFNAGSLAAAGPGAVGQTTEHYLSADAGGTPFVIADSIRIQAPIRGSVMGLCINTLPRWVQDDAGNWRMIAHEIISGLGSSRDRQLPPGRVRIGMALFLPNAVANFRDWAVVTLFNRG